MRMLDSLLSRIVRHSVRNPQRGLGEDWFLTISSLTPMVNVDLLLQRSGSTGRETLLTWRDDAFYRGWHFPGGVVRFQEDLGTRVKRVALTELGQSVTKIEGPLVVRNIVNPSRRLRGHFVSLLFRAELDGEPVHERAAASGNSAEAGQWHWFEFPPTSLIPQHREYERFF